VESCCAFRLPEDQQQTGTALQTVNIEKSDAALMEERTHNIDQAPTDSGARLKILLVAHKFPPFIGGIEMHTFEVGRRMAVKGHSVTVLTGDPSGKLPRDEIVAGMRVVRVRVYPKSSDIFFSPGVYREVTKSAWDVIHVQGFHTFVPPIAMMGAIRKGAAFVLTFHSGGHSSPLRNIIRGIQRAVLKPLIVRADKLIGVSEFEAAHFARGLGVPSEKIIVVPNGAEIDVASDAAPIDQTNPLILTIGRLERYKGHQRVIAAFEELLKKRPGAELRVLGEGPYKSELVDLVRQKGLQSKVTVGGIPPAERKRMGAMLSKAAVVVLLSDYEAHPVAALEAIAAGRPVIASNTTGFAEMAAKGLLRGIDPNSAPSLVADAIIEEIDRPASSKARIAINNWDDCTSDLIQVYRDVLLQRQGAGSATQNRGLARQSVLPEGKGIGA
jgi:glycosyltransferase involved in cell wall biosynthesis